MNKHQTWNSSTDVAKELRVTETAWRMGHKIQNIFANKNHNLLLRGIVQMDEISFTYGFLKTRKILGE
ncbi:hypothetical protein [Spiroplasma endosymbiont of Lariophagus distinguendus]|uniref:hypothetical protein n=1 Tax=Spiroplasma endosymbiont of Lariophagus distinguendus TaxID=2935082 RepID=UPI00207A3CB6|nr:hypothetical protein [Spiroplasma endosymbiont of Lariophagus distinguendus]